MQLRPSRRKRCRFKKQSGKSCAPTASLSLPQQMAAMRWHFPGFIFKHGKRGICWRGELRPTEDGPIYRVRVEWHAPRAPRVWVESPALHPKAPHLYRQGCLCLYYPKDRNWTPEVAIAESIVPWTAVWLYFYELWLVNNHQWLGPEAPHNQRVDRRARKH